MERDSTVSSKSSLASRSVHAVIVLSSAALILSGASSLSAKETVDTAEMRACPLFVKAEQFSDPDQTAVTQTDRLPKRLDVYSSTEARKFPIVLLPDLLLIILNCSCQNSESPMSLNLIERGSISEAEG